MFHNDDSPTICALIAALCGLFDVILDMVGGAMVALQVVWVQCKVGEDERNQNRVRELLIVVISLAKYCFTFYQFMILTMSNPRTRYDSIIAIFCMFFCFCSQDLGD